MDDIVRQAMAKWPQVPHCTGWLGLDARGNWYMRDDRAQAQGGFASGLPGAKGSRLQHEKLIDFIGRNYACESTGAYAGQWFFQNGPQRVFVELEATPWVWRVDYAEGLFVVHSHTGLPARPQRCALDEHGRLYLETELGFGLVHTQDMVLAADALEQGLWVAQSVLTRELPTRFAYVRSPHAQHASAINAIK